MKGSLYDDWQNLGEAVREFGRAVLEEVTPFLIWIIERLENLIFWVQARTKRGQVVGEATYATIMAILDEDDEGEALEGKMEFDDYDYDSKPWIDDEPLSDDES